MEKITTSYIIFYGFLSSRMFQQKRSLSTRQFPTAWPEAWHVSIMNHPHGPSKSLERPHCISAQNAESPPKDCWMSCSALKIR